MHAIVTTTVVKNNEIPTINIGITKYQNTKDGTIVIKSGNQSNKHLSSNEFEIC